jgi:hypothetical protein
VNHPKAQQFALQKGIAMKKSMGIPFRIHARQLPEDEEMVALVETSEHFFEGDPGVVGVEI